MPSDAPRFGRAILVFSLISLALGGFDFIVFFLEVAGAIPINSPSPDYAIIDGMRTICYEIAYYVGIAAVAFALYRAAQARQHSWMTGILLVVIVSLVLAGISNDPLQFFSRQRYIYLDVLIFAAIGHLSSFITMIYALATRPRNNPIIVPPAPSLYQPMMYPPPAPYGPPVSYAPPPPVVLPAPQPPTMTTPS